MRKRFRLYKRKNGGRYYIHDEVTGKQDSLHTSDRATAVRLFHSRQEAEQQPAVNLQIARAYLAASDPQIATRDWQFVMEELVKLKKDQTQHRWQTAIKDKAFDLIRHLPLLETRPEHFLRVLETGKVSTNIYLRRIHNFALDMNWLPWPVLAKKRWPAVEFKEKRAITLAEHLAIVARETNPERKAFYKLAWHLGASQSDLAFLEAENIDWDNHVISYKRKKTKTVAIMRFDDDMAEILRDLAGSGPLFPYLRTVRAGDRATEFKQRCDGLGIKGISLHSYRYAWAERAKTAGYPERYAQVNLGHNSKAMTRAYSRKAEVEMPSLSEYERQQKAVIGKALGCLEDASDDGGFWKNRNVETLVKEMSRWNETVAALGGKIKDILGEGVEMPISDYPNFEQLEMAGQNKLPPQIEELALLIKQVSHKN